MPKIKNFKPTHKDTYHFAMMAFIILPLNMKNKKQNDSVALFSQS